MNIWQQFNLANQSFLSDWRILYWRTLLYLHSLGNKKENLAEFNLVDFRNSPNRQNKFYVKFSSYTLCNITYTDVHMCIYTCTHIYVHTYAYVHMYSILT